jgi:hypothetical protein
LELNVTHQLLVYADDVNLLGDSVNTTKDIGLGAFAASELDKVFSGYQPR